MPVHLIPRKGSCWERRLLTQKTNLRFDFKNGMRNVHKRISHLDKNSYQMEELYNWLKNENASQRLSSLQKKNLSSIRTNQALFVITGQQPGILGGPLLWFWKSLSAISLAQKISKKISRPCVPIFWIAGDDSDLREVNRLTLLERRPDPYTFSIAQPQTHKLVPVASRPLGPGVDALLEQLERYWRPDIIDLARSFLNPSANFANHFQEIAQKYLGEQGILFLNGHSREFRQLSSPLRRKIVSSAKKFEILLNEQSNALRKEGDKPQVHFRQGVVHLFSTKMGERERLFYNDKNIYTQNGESFCMRDIHSWWEKESVSFTHDVVSRPLLIDSVMPVLGHVLGPSEMGYFFQLKKVFLHFTGSQPLMHPRMTAALVSQDPFLKFEEYGIKKEVLSALSQSQLNVYLMNRAWKKEKMNTSISIPLEASIRLQLKNALGVAWNESLYSGLKKKTLKNLRQFESRIQKDWFNSRKPKFSTLFAELDWLGRGGGQDRYLNLFSLLNRFGDDVLSTVTRQIDALEWKKQLVSLDKPN